MHFRTPTRELPPVSLVHLVLDHSKLGHRQRNHLVHHRTDFFPIRYRTILQPEPAKCDHGVVGAMQKVWGAFEKTVREEVVSEEEGDVGWFRL